MLSFVAVPKAFRPPFAAIQRTAIVSWTELAGCEVLLFGNDEGVAEEAAALGARHVPHVARNEFGTPLLGDILSRARQLAAYELICYANADVVLEATLLGATRRAEAFDARFLLIGRCTDVLVPDVVQDPRERLTALRAAAGYSPTRDHRYLDWFVFPKALFEDVPQFAIGRAAFDNWLVWRARDLGARVIDGTGVVAAIHQRHDYPHVSGGRHGAYFGTEAQHNIELAGGDRHLFTIWDATHRLTRRRVRRNFGGIGRVRTRASRLGARMRWQARHGFPALKSVRRRTSS